MVQTPERGNGLDHVRTVHSVLVPYGYSFQGVLMTETTEPEEWWVCIGMKRHSGPWSNHDDAKRWAETELKKGTTYYLEKQEDVL